MRLFAQRTQSINRLSNWEPASVFFSLSPPQVQNGKWNKNEPSFLRASFRNRRAWACSLLPRTKQLRILTQVASSNSNRSQLTEAQAARLLLYCGCRAPAPTRAASPHSHSSLWAAAAERTKFHKSRGKFHFRPDKHTSRNWALSFQISTPTKINDAHQ